MEYRYEVVKFPQNIPAKIWNQSMAGHEMYTPSHWHRSLEIDLVLEGRMKVMVNGISRILLPGDFLFVNSGDIHETDYVDARDSLLGITILISYDYISQWLPDYADYYFDLDKAPALYTEIPGLCRQIGLLLKEKAPYYELQITTCIQKLLYLLFSTALTDKNHSFYWKQQKEFEKVRLVIDYLNKHYKEAVHLNDVALLSGFAPAYFSRYFKRQTGTNFYSYLNHIRLHNALIQLLSGDISSTDCALNNGFPNVKSFIEMFKKVYQCTPGQYKKLYQKNKEGIPKL